LQQTFTNFEVVISDNDPHGSAAEVVAEFKDSRLQYYSNIENLGMIKSFNKSIQRAKGKFIVMITDDDPVVPEMLARFHGIISDNPGFGIYCGCDRGPKFSGKIETFDKYDFVYQLLHPALTRNLLWSSCLIETDVLKSSGGMPDYGSPHLADHLMLARCGAINGGIMINRMFSSLTDHNNNFSKNNLELYFIACEQFHRQVVGYFEAKMYIQGGSNALLKHLERWFITYSFALRKYYTHISPDNEKIKMVNSDAQKVLSLPFMVNVKKKYYQKLAIFKVKSIMIKLGLMN
jgi:glycosyltransferase involved in cell wall biosynthesis